MLVTLTTPSEKVVAVDVCGDMEFENFKVLCEAELNIPLQEIKIYKDGRELQGDKKNLAELGVGDGDVLLIQQCAVAPPAYQVPNFGIDFSAIRVPGQFNQPTSSRGPQPATSSVFQQKSDSIFKELTDYPEQLALLKINNPSLADAFTSGDRSVFDTVLRDQLQAKADEDRKHIQLINSDPFDAKAQKMIEEKINQENVNDNMEAAIEHHPEIFGGQVTMLYVQCRVNGHPIRAFVDSGAQTTLMSGACAERCEMMRLVDRRWNGIARGIGTQKIIGRIHLGTIQIENDFLQSSFSVLENQALDVLIGLDMLKRHQCAIDLKRNVLVIGTTGTETKFLSDAEISDIRMDTEDYVQNKESKERIN